MKHVGWTVGCALLWLGCSEWSDSGAPPAEEAEIVANLLQAGFPRDDIQTGDGVVHVGRDAVVSLAASREMVASADGDSREHYRTTNVVSPAVTEICVQAWTTPGVLLNALDAAIANYNALALSFSMRRTSGFNVGCSAVIVASQVVGSADPAGFPAGGMPYGQIEIDPNLISYGQAVLEHLFTHALGHTVGLRHTDYYNRSISCGVGGNEGSAGVGAVHIPGTPTTASSGTSVMNSCFDGSESGDFSAADITALRTLYPLRNPTTWTTSYSNGAGWMASPWYWSTIRYPDLNGDGRDDVCGRGGGGIFCALSNGSGFGATSYWTTKYSDGNNWASAEFYWGTIRFPDLNGDGKADVCGRGGGGIFCALSTGSSFGTVNYWTPRYSNADGWNVAESNWRTIEYPDLNGDGKADVCGRANAGLSCALSDGTSFGPSSYWSTAFSNATGWSGNKAYWGTIQYPDINGDGKADVCGRWVNGLYCAVSSGTAFGAPSYWSTGYSDASGWGSSEKTWGTIRYPDLNGDGRADVCGWNSSLSCSLSTGFSLGTPSYWSGLLVFASEEESYWRTIQYPDLDGDGKADVCGRALAGVLCARSLGNTFDNGGFRTSNFSDYHNWGSSPAYWGTLRFPDVTGDGKADVCGRGGSGILCSL